MEVARGMAPEPHKFARQLFEQALDLPESERLSFLQSACRGNQEVFEEAKGLLISHGQATSFLDSAEETRPSPAIGRYRLTGKELGRGGMGVVYEAMDPDLRRKVAIKTINLAGAENAEDLRKGLEKEARLAGALSHPGIVVIHDMVVQHPYVYVVMELLDGPSVHEILKAGPAPFGKALDILQQVAAALDYAHQNNIVHRDIKPQNLMFHQGNLVKITDFGIATIALAAKSTGTTAGLGTPQYMSPERIQMSPVVDGRSDQFSLAVIAYQLLTGVSPFEGGGTIAIVNKIVNGPRPSARTVNPALPSRVDDVLRRGLAQLPGERYPTCTEFVSALKTALEEGKGPGPKILRLIAAAAICVALLAGGLSYFERRPQNHLASQISERKAKEDSPSHPATSAQPTETPSNVDTPTPGDSGAAALSSNSAQAAPASQQTPPTPAQPAPMSAEKLVKPASPSVAPAIPDQRERKAVQPSSNSAQAAPSGQQTLPITAQPAPMSAEKLVKPANPPVAPAHPDQRERKAASPASNSAQAAPTSQQTQPRMAQPVPMSAEKPAPALPDRHLPQSQPLRASVPHPPEQSSHTQLSEHLAAPSPSIDNPVRSLLAAADAGNPKAMDELGQRYEQGSGIPRDPKSAIQWYTKGGSAGEADALYHLGRMYETGTGTVKNINEAIRLYQKAAAAGNIEARTRLGQLPAAALRPAPKSSPPPLVMPPGAVAVTVPANRAWTDTGISLRPGDQITVTASGLITVSADGLIPPKAPGGFAPDCDAAQAIYRASSGPFPARRLPCWSLIGRVGPNGMVFEIGAHSIFQARTAGRLFLGVNDDNVQDNSGFWTAGVLVTGR